MGEGVTVRQVLLAFVVPASLFGGVALTGVIAGLALAPAEASKEFYSAAAGAIPVLLLTLAVQARFFALPTWTEAIATFGLPRQEADEEVRAYLARALADFVVRYPARQRFLERMVIGTALLGLLVVAEFAALHPLATGKPPDGNPEVVYIALTTGFAMIGVLALLGRIEAQRARGKP